MLPCHHGNTVRRNAENDVRSGFDAGEDRLGLIAPEPRTHQLAKRGMHTAPPTAAPPGEFVRGVQPQTDDRDPGILKYGQQTRAYAHGILHGMLPDTSPPATGHRAAYRGE